MLTICAINFNWLEFLFKSAKLFDSITDSIRSVEFVFGETISTRENLLISDLIH